MIGKVLALFRSQKVLSMMSSVSGAALGLLTFGLLARTLSKTDFGVFSIFLAFQTVFEMLRNGLVGKPLIKFAAESDDEVLTRNIIGSSWRLGLRSSLLVGLLFTLIFLGIYALYGDRDFLLYSYYFLPIALLSLPSNMATWVLNARLRFDKMIWIRTSMQVVYIAGVFYAYVSDYGNLDFIFITYLVASTLPSIISLLAGWDGLVHIKVATKAKSRELYLYGRYTMGTLIGGTLLRSSDDFLIRFFLGPEAVAIYQIPQRLVNLIDIPLRALVSFSFPSLARANKSGDASKFRKEFELSTGFAFVVLFPAALGTFIFADSLVVLLGGAEYAESAVLLRIFSFFMAFTALDRYSGVGLDVLDRPKINMNKVIIMLVINIVGDLLALYIFEDIRWVAFVSILTFGGGTLFGFRYLKDVIPFHFFKWVKLGINESLRLVKKLVRK
jgi:O-antigen/teichoic acid export membrane protein